MTLPNKKQQKLRLQVLNHWKFGLYLFMKLPMGWLAGLRIRELTEAHCVTSVPFKWLTQNPFESMYFAVQSMAAELSTAAGCMVAVQGYHPSIAFIIIDLKATFHKKATGRVYFTCNEVSKAYEAVQTCLQSKESVTHTFKTAGKLKDGTLVSEFEFTWSFKQRAS